MPTLAEIQQFIQANINKPNAAALISDAAIQNNVSLAQLAEAASGALGQPITEAQVQGYFQNAWQSDNDPATSGMTNYLPGTGVNVPNNAMGGEPTGGSSSNPALDIPRQQSADEWATQIGRVSCRERV